MQASDELANARLRETLLAQGVISLQPFEAILQIPEFQLSLFVFLGGHDHNSTSTSLFCLLCPTGGIGLGGFYGRGLF